MKESIERISSKVIEPVGEGEEGEEVGGCKGSGEGGKRKDKEVRKGRLRRG